MTRRGRPRKGIVKDPINNKIRVKQIRGLKREVKESSGQMTSMFNSLFRPGRPVGCFCGDCQTPLPKRARFSSEDVQLERSDLVMSEKPRVWPRAMVWLAEGHDQIGLPQLGSPCGTQPGPSFSPQPGPSWRSDPLPPQEPSPTPFWRPFADPSVGQSAIDGPESESIEEDPLKIPLCVCEIEAGGIGSVVKGLHASSRRPSLCNMRTWRIASLSGRCM
ncbi:uncharacterized protein LOC127279574 [Leptopilina boulardi]|uniref:uncharacterized protein LOC127279574 n=1 Tax=Leptopilina boulardi TaxID=63433 RepID=UPI0021F5F09F|nr:uncharacterized protein LOC127279574 [Leptopilina boulardi]